MSIPALYAERSELGFLYCTPKAYFTGHQFATLLAYSGDVQLFREFGSKKYDLMHEDSQLSLRFISMYVTAKNWGEVLAVLNERVQDVNVYRYYELLLETMLLNMTDSDFFKCKEAARMMFNTKVETTIAQMTLLQPQMKQVYEGLVHLKLPANVIVSPN